MIELYSDEQDSKNYTDHQNRFNYPLSLSDTHDSESPDCIIFVGQNDQQLTFYNMDDELVSNLKQKYKQRFNIEQKICIVESKKYKRRVSQKQKVKMLKQEFSGQQIFYVVLFQVSKPPFENKESGIDSDEQIYPEGSNKLLSFQLTYNNIHPQLIDYDSNKQMKMSKIAKNMFLSINFNKDSKNLDKSILKIQQVVIQIPKYEKYNPSVSQQLKIPVTNQNIKVKKNHRPKNYFFSVGERIIRPYEKLKVIESQFSQNEPFQILDGYCLKPYRRRFLQLYTFNPCMPTQIFFKKHRKDIDKSLYYYSSQGYRQILRQLRDENTLFLKTVQTSEYLKMSKFIFNGLNALKICNEIVYRGNSGFNFTHNYRQGQMICFKGFTSTSRDIEKARKFTYRETQNKTIFKIKSVTGRCIQNYSKFPGEKQVLFAPYSYFYIQKIKIAQNKIGFTQFQLTEIPFPNMQTKKIIILTKQFQYSRLIQQLVLKKKNVQLIKLERRQHLRSWVRQFMILMNYQKADVRILVDGDISYVNEKNCDVQSIGFDIQLFRELRIIQKLVMVTCYKKEYEQSFKNKQKLSIIDKNLIGNWIQSWAIN